MMRTDGAVKPANTSHSKRFLQHFLMEWGVVLLSLTVVLITLSKTDIVGMTNNYTYDRLLTFSEREADPRIVIVGIDDSSLRMLGIWPWSRQTHADFLHQLKQYEPKAVLFDVLTLEPSVNPLDDVQLGEAMGQFDRIAAPVLLISYAGEPTDVTMPVDSVARHALLGHIVQNPDPDGVVRQTAFNIKDKNGTSWPVLTRLLTGNDDVNDELDEPDALFRIPFNVPKGRYTTLPYWSILNHQVPANFLQGKYVLVGATAQGLGDQRVTPVSGEKGTVAGIEIHANILDTLLNHLQIHDLNQPWLQQLNVVSPFVVLMLLFLWVGERFYLLTFILCVTLYMSFVAYMLWVQRMWLPPVSGIIGLSLTYLVWSWRRSIVVLAYVDSGLKNAQNHLGTLPHFFSTPERSHFLPRSLEQGMSQINQLYQFTGDSLMHLPTSLVVASSDGKILMSNQMALDLFRINETYLDDLLERIDSNLDLSEFVGSPHCWELLQGLELNGAQHGQFFQLHLTNVVFGNHDRGQTFDSGETIWLINFMNLSAERQAQQQRAELLEFLSHDLRTPQVSILSLLELQQHQATRLSEQEFFERISNKVHHTLGWANDLVHLSKARSSQYRFNEINFANVVDEVIEQIWPQAQAKGIHLLINEYGRALAEQSWVQADGALLTRALINLLSNAVRYSVSDTTVEFVVEHHHREELNDIHRKIPIPVTSPTRIENWLTCHIIDQGQGMTDVQLGRLQTGETHQLDGQSNAGNIPDAAQSLGIGFVMARTVVERHGGWLDVSSELGKGTQITVWLPLCEETVESMH
ncbi:Sensor histidine kinase WalK [Ephemeroptericola cinctiostellae]|uniref:histidine kinase n=1 Tax=Ephemeroptericola cinctiostellae TaxID=2268024 RepID=A0A345DCG1_9BURK|nr:CHASE2 domain-containing protein [Ephemeroptericola cinctiostellae]AXF86049.1 Sensor histidine kinase WalK [Ephemeroptericola cinctiostellae]